MEELLEDLRPRIDAAIEEVLPRQVDEDYLSDFFGPPSYRYDAAGIQQALSEPVWDLLDRGGKRWRVVVFLQFLEAFGHDDPDSLLAYAIIPEILHNGTIIVDDVEDNALMRRGEEALHLKYGEDVALNAGNALYFLPLKIIAHNPADLDHDVQLEVYNMLMYELNRTHLGQGMDICWHNERDIRASVDEYLEMTACKTGCLAKIVARLASIITGQPATTERAVADYAEALAIAFQIGDDILDIEHTMDRAGDFGKSFGNDIREGKTTLMAIHTAERAAPAERERLESILSANEVTREEVLEVIELYERYDSIEFAKEQAHTLADEASDYLRQVELEPAPTQRLIDFTRFVIERDR